MVVHAHESYFEKLDDEYGKDIEKIISGSEKVIAVSEYQKKTVISRHVNSSGRIDVVYNGVDTKRFRPIEKRGDVAARQPRLVFVGHLVDRKGVDILIEAVDLLKDDFSFTLDIYGEGSEGKKYGEMVENKRLSHIVNFKGLINNDRLSKVLPDYTCLILPSRKETFGIVLIEAMACGIPVVVSKVGAAEEIVSQGESGVLVDAFDPASLARGIKSILLGQWDVRKISACGRRFSLESAVEDIERIYEQSYKGGL